MGNHDLVADAGVEGLAQLVCHALEALLATAGLVHHVHGAVLIDAHDGLELEEVGCQGAGAGQPATAQDVPEVVDRDPVGGLHAVVLDPRDHIVELGARALHERGLLDEQALAEGRGDGLDADDAALRVLLLQALADVVDGIIGARKRRGEAQVEEVFALLEQLDEGLAGLLGVG